VCTQSNYYCKINEIKGIPILENALKDGTFKCALEAITTAKPTKWKEYESWKTHRKTHNEKSEHFRKTKRPRNLDIVRLCLQTSCIFIKNKKKVCEHYEAIKVREKLECCGLG
jgi:hypothetical protein